jgi:hypothetical protein
MKGAFLLFEKIMMLPQPQTTIPLDSFVCLGLTLLLGYALLDLNYKEVFFVICIKPLTVLITTFY